MASHRSAEKRSRQNEKRRIRNSAVKSGVKTRIKAVIAAVTAKDQESSRAALATAIPALNKAAAKGIIHTKTASRKISRITRRVNAL